MNKIFAQVSTRMAQAGTRDCKMARLQLKMEGSSGRDKSAMLEHLVLEGWKSD